jgi:hypothetical protein
MCVELGCVKEYRIVCNRKSRVFLFFRVNNARTGTVVSSVYERKLCYTRWRKLYAVHIVFPSRTTTATTILNGVALHKLATDFRSLDSKA